MATHAQKRHQDSKSSVIVLAGVILALYFGRDVFIPIVFAGLAALLLTPIVAALEKTHIPRALAILLVLLALGGVLAGFAWTIGDELIETANDLAAYRENVRRKVERLRSGANSALGRAVRNIEEFGRDLDQSHAGSSESATPAARTLSKSESSKPVPVDVVDHSGSYPAVFHYSLLALRPLGLMIITLAATSFILLRRENIRNRLLRLAGADQGERGHRRDRHEPAAEAHRSHRPRDAVTSGPTRAARRRRAGRPGQVSYLGRTGYDTGQAVPALGKAIHH